MFLFLSFGASWMSVTHLSVGHHAFHLLEKEKPEVFKFFSSNEIHKTYLFFGLVDPDIIEMSRGTHYYIYQPGENKGQYYPPGNGSKYYSARIHLEEHYANAVSLYEKGNIIRAFHQLGMACHYLADCGTPPHTAGIQFPMNPLAPNPHHAFEKYVDKHCDEYNATSAIDLYGSLDDAKLGYTVNDMAKKSSSYKDIVLSMDPLKYPEALPVSLGISQQYTAVLLEKFYRKVSSK